MNKEDNKTKDELLQEVKKLREEVEKDNKEKKQSRTSTDLMWGGIGLIIIVIVIWWFARSCGIL